MKNPFFTVPVLVCLLTALVLGGLTLGPFMHETDQGWLMNGGLAISQGHPEVAQSEFNFDKQFVTYWVAGALALFFPRPVSGDALVLGGNVLNMVLFWGALGWLLARSARRLSWVVTLPVILTPAFLVHSPFYASAFVSAALVLVLAVYVAGRRTGRLHYFLIWMLAFLAVGARADALFLLPLLAMLHSPQRTFLSALRSPTTWLMATGGLTAFIIGRLWYPIVSTDYAVHPFRPKIYVGYMAAGLGATTLILLVGLHSLWSARRSKRCGWWMLFTGLGLALPMTYYSLQLLSPRHCVVGAISVALFVCSRRGRMLLQNYRRALQWKRVWQAAAVLGAVVPLFLGLDADHIRQPRITFSAPTLLPSVAGVCPTGAYLAHAWNVRTQNGFIDHNHAVWAAAKNTKFVPDATGKVPFLFSPIESYLIFAIRLQGLEPLHYSLADGQCPPWFYVESRSLMRFQYTWPPKKVSMDDFLAHSTFSPVTTQSWRGITMMRGETNAMPTNTLLNGALWALNRTFGLDEFRIEKTSATFTVPANSHGGKLVIVGRPGFTVEGPGCGPAISMTHPHLGEWQVIQIPTAKAGDKYQISSSVIADVFIGISVFPEWMSLQKL